MATLTSIDLGQVTREKITITSGLFKAQIPLRSTKNNLLAPVFGKTRVVYIEGMVTGNATSLKSFVDSVETWINDTTGLSIQSSREFTPTLDITNAPFNVICDAFEWDYTEGEITKINYAMTLIEGGITGGFF